MFMANCSCLLWLYCCQLYYNSVSSLMTGFGRWMSSRLESLQTGFCCLLLDQCDKLNPWESHVELAIFGRKVGSFETKICIHWFVIRPLFGLVIICSLFWTQAIWYWALDCVFVKKTLSGFSEILKLVAKANDTLENRSLVCSKWVVGLLMVVSNVNISITFCSWSCNWELSMSQFLNGSHTCRDIF